MSRPWPPCATFQMIPAIFTRATPYKEHKKHKNTSSSRKQEEGEAVTGRKVNDEELFNMIFENMSTWLPISFRLIKFPLEFSFPCGFGMLFNCFRAQVGETTSWKLLGRNKSKPKFMFCLKFLPKWISALHLGLLPRKILSDTSVATIRKGLLNEVGCLIG